MSQTVKVKGYGRAVFPDHFTKEQMRTALRKKFNNAAESTAGALDAAATVGSAVVAEPVSGLAGIGSSVYNMDASKGADTVKAVQDAMTYQPRTAKGQEYLQNVSEFVEPVANLIGSASQNLGDKAYAATGSPTLAAAAYSVPTAIAEGIGLKGLNIARKPVSKADLYAVRMGMGDIPDAYKENFNNWFDQSHARDEVGNPVVLYHGTTKDVDSFSLDNFGKTDQGWFGEGFYFAESPADASSYAASFDGAGRRNDFGGNVMPVYLNIKTPLIWESGTETAKILSELRAELGPKGFSDWLDGNGYDGVKFIGPEVEGFPRDIQWMALRPEQIKSAVGNSGAFNKKSNKINE